MNIERQEYLLRQESLHSLMELHQLDGLILSGEHNVQYLCGYSQQDSVLAVYDGRIVMAVGEAYAADAKDHAVVSEVIGKGKSSHDIAAGILYVAGVRRVGFDSKETNASVTYDIRQVLGPRIEMCHADHLVSCLREIKSVSEQEAIMQAIRSAERGFLSMLEKFSALDTEKQAAAKIDYGMRMNGAEDLSFPVKTSFGVNSGVPHRMPTDNVMLPGDPVMYDFGASVGGYCSDMTRMGVRKPCDAFWVDRFKLIMSCMQMLEGVIKPGLKCADAWQMAHDHMAPAGGEFVFALGHGIGLEVHEGPHMSRYTTDTFKTGQVVCIEPGVYYYGKGCMRTEDMYLVTDNGLHRLTALPHAGF